MTHIFLHIPKNGGSTLTDIILRQYPSNTTCLIDTINHKPNFTNLYSLSKTERKKIEILTGHGSFGVHNQFEQPCKYFTILRHPVSRILSFYNYALKYPEAFDENYNLNSLYDFVSKTKSGDVHNGQTRLIAGLEVEETKMLEIAFNNIKNDFSAIGFIEDYKTSLLLFKQKLNWKKIYFEKKNRGNYSNHTISEEIISLIKERNKYDLMLYDCMLEKYNNWKKNNAAYIKYQLINLHFWNTAYKLKHLS